MSPRPTLSVVIPAYNEEEALPRQLAAIQAQDPPCDEIVLVDDGSTDGTWQLMVGAAAPEGPSLVLAHHETPRGVNEACNAGVADATGDWVYCASANDVVHPGAFQVFHRALGMFPDAVLIAGYPAAVPIRWNRPPAALTPEQVARMGFPLHGAACFVRRDAYRIHGGLHPDLAWLGDFWLFHTLAFRHGCVWLAEPVVTVHHRPDEFSAGWQDPARLAPVQQALVGQLTAPQYAATLPAWRASGFLTINPVGGPRFQEHLEYLLAQRDLVTA